jgi:hypothetical protein
MRSRSWFFCTLHAVTGVMQCGHALGAAALVKPASEDVLQVCSVLKWMNSSNAERAECGQSGQF